MMMMMNVVAADWVRLLRQSGKEFLVLSVGRSFVLLVPLLID